MKHFSALSCALLLTALLAHAAAAAPPGYYADQKVVYQNNGGGQDNAAYFTRLLHNLRNHVAAVGEKHVEIRVVDFGDGVVMLQLAKTDDKLARLIDERRAEGVRFLICQNTLNERHIDWRTLYGETEEDIVPSGVAELVRLQMMGFMYVHP